MLHLVGNISRGTKIHIYRHFQLRVIIFHQHVLVTLVTIISMSINKSIINRPTQVGSKSRSDTTRSGIVLFK